MRPLIAVPGTIAIVYRAYSRRSLTSSGLLVATLTAVLHALHPSSVPFTLLGTFFLAGTTATKIKHDVKATLTVSSSGNSGGEGPRTSIQVLANSGMASLLVLLHTWRYGLDQRTSCFGEDEVADILLLGIVSNYAAVAADTFSSELGILSKSPPVLITSLKTVPKGTNGGVSIAGLLAGVLGSAIIAIAAALLLPFCGQHNSVLDKTKQITGQQAAWSTQEKVLLMVAITIWGTFGSLLDSLLGALLQASVVDERTGKVIESSGGIKVLTGSQSARGSLKNNDHPSHGSRSIHSGRDILDNNQINLLMAALMSIGGMVVASSIWKVPENGLLSSR